MLRRSTLLAAGFTLATLRHAVAEPRLATDVIPTAQAVELTVDPTLPDYGGRVAIDLDVRIATSSFALHAVGMSISNVSLEAGERHLAIRHAVADGRLTIETHAPLAVGRHRLSVEFARPFGQRAHGLYRVEKNGRHYSYTDLEPTGAREVFPCFDEPAFKIPFTVSAIVPEMNEVLANAPIASSTRGLDGRKTVRFQATPPLPTYLFALMSGPFDTRDLPGLGVPGRVVTTAGDAGNVELAATTTAPLLKALETWFGSPYPYAKLDLIAVPEYWAGAMENPGAITYSERVLVLDPARITLADRRRQFRITAHELAHQWFGDYVTMQWWDDVWLNESFADWMGDKITTMVHPEVGIELEELARIQGTMAEDARPSAEPIRRPVAAAEEALRNVGTVYLKGKSVLGMFELWMGADKFQAGVRQYLANHAWGNATADDLWAALSEAADADVASALRTFVDQPGVPIVEVEATDGGVRLSQRRFHPAGTKVTPLTWQIPVGLRYARGGAIETREVLLDGRSTTVRLGDRAIDWIMPNRGARGWYFWKLPEGMLRQLLLDPGSRLPDPRERIGLLGNLGALFRVGELRAQLYLDTLAALANDENPQVVSAVLTEIGELDRTFVSARLERDFATWIRRTLGPTLARYGREAVAGEDELVSLLRPRLLLLLGDQGQDGEVRAFADAAAARYLQDPMAVDPAIAEVLVALYAQRGDARLYDEIRSRFETARDPGDRSRFLATLGEFRDPAIRARALRYAIEGPLRSPEVTDIAESMGRTRTGRDPVWTWFTDNYDKILERAPGPTQPWLAYFASNCDARRITEAEKFFADPRHQVPGTLETLAKVLDAARDCVSLKSRSGRDVATYWAGRPQRGRAAVAGE